MTWPYHSAQLRITREDAGARLTTFRLEGRLTDAGWEALAGARETCRGRLLALDLSGLRYLDSSAARRLASWRREGVGLCGGSGFIRELLHSADRLAADARSSPDLGAQGGSR